MPVTFPYPLGPPLRHCFGPAGTAHSPLLPNPPFACPPPLRSELLYYIAIVAAEDIPAFTELTYDYGADYVVQVRAAIPSSTSRLVTCESWSACGPMDQAQALQQAAALQCGLVLCQQPAWHDVCSLACATHMGHCTPRAASDTAADRLTLAPSHCLPCPATCESINSVLVVGAQLTACTD